MSENIRLNVLDNLRIASPCPVRWEDMTGDDRTRHCDQCNLNVYNVSSMTRDEATTLITGKTGRLCVGFFQRADGTIITRDCPVGLRAVRARARRIMGRVAAALGLMLTGAVTVGAKLSGTEPARVRAMQPFVRVSEWLSPTPTPPIRWIAGDVAIPTPPPASTGTASTTGGAS